MSRFIFGVFVFVAGFSVFNGLSGGSMAMFINLHGMMLTASFLAAGFIASGWRLDDLGCALRGSVSDWRHVARLSEMLSFMKKVSFISGVIGSMAGAIMILSFLNDASRLGKAIAVALLVPFYCAVFYLFCEVLRARIRIAD